MLVKGYVHHVEIVCGSEVIASHPRSYDRECTICSPVHYLALLEQKSRALDSGRAKTPPDWRLPDLLLPVATSARSASQQKRQPAEYIKVLRLMETFALAEVTKRRRRCPRMRAIGFDAVRHLLLCRIRRRPP